MPMNVQMTSESTTSVLSKWPSFSKATFAEHLHILTGGKSKQALTAFKRQMKNICLYKLESKYTVCISDYISVTHIKVFFLWVWCVCVGGGGYEGKRS